MRKLLVLSIVVAAMGGGVATNTAQAHDFDSRSVSKKPLKMQLHYYQGRIHKARSTIRFWNSPTQRWRFNGLHPAGALVGSADLAYHKRLLKWATRNYKVAYEKYQASLVPANYSAWLCIHRYEGAWNANTGNGYYGGLQMDYGFQRTYGSELLASKGTANNWTPYEQMAVANRAYYSGRGFYPWPNTARYCGLI